LIALQTLVLLLERPTDDSIEIAVGFTREVGAFLQENSPKANAAVFERFRAVLNEGGIKHRVRYMFEVLMQVRKDKDEDKDKDDPILSEGLDLVEEEEHSRKPARGGFQGLSMYPICYTSIVFKWSAGRYFQVRLKFRCKRGKVQDYQG